MIALFDGKAHENLKPLTYTRPVASLRVGIFTLKEKWEYYLNDEVSISTQDYISTTENVDHADIGVFAAILPSASIANEVAELNENEVLVNGSEVIALRPYINFNDTSDLSAYNKVELKSEVSILQYPWDIFKLNDQEIKNDFEIVKVTRSPQQIDASNIVLGERVFVEEGASVFASTLNSLNGPIFIAKNAEVMEGCHIRGSFALLENAVLKMGAKIYGATTFGPYSKVGGEVGNSVIIGYSNKGHDGYLGNSVLGEWCNLGADTNTSNLKNNYSSVRVYNYPAKKAIDSGEQFCGLIMGDHSKAGINTMFNTGTVVGVAANVFGGGFPPKFIPSFSWGGAEGFETFRLEKAFEVAERVMKRRNIPFTDTDKKEMEFIFNTSKALRNE